MNRRDQHPEPQSVDATCENMQQRCVPAKAGHWPDIARMWEQVGPPLRPAAPDIAFLKEEIDSWVRDKGALRALILGVTPELYHLPWSEGTDILAVDNTQSMIDTVWPGPRTSVMCDDWTTMSLSAGSRDIAMCDGAINLLEYPHEHLQLAQTLHRVIAPDGLCILRLFVPPEEREEPDMVLQDLLDAKIPNLNQLKFRLWMALHEDVSRGVEVRRVWDAIHRVAPDFGRLASRIGWSLDHLSAINTYRDCPARYHFLSVDDVCHLFCESPGGFALETVHVPTYELGQQCPTVVLRRDDTDYEHGDV
jgi:SAM-dependent methyltransferase